MTLNASVVFINIFAFCLLVISAIKDKTRTIKSLIISAKLFIRILPAVISMVILVGLVLAIVSQEQIQRIMGEQSGFGGIVVAGLIGAVLHIPALISFPMAASLLQSGASVSVVSVFISALTLIGVVTLPMEINELGKKIALLRNAISFIIAVIIAFIMGRIL